MELSGLTPIPGSTVNPGVTPNRPYVNFGNGDYSGYLLDISGPEFGPGDSFVPASSSIGDALQFNLTFLSVTADYDSERALSATMTFVGQSFSDLGITPGTYEYSYEYEVDVPSLTGGDLEIAASLPPQTLGSTITINAVPEPSAFLYGGLISVLAGCGYRIKRRLA